MTQQVQLVDIMPTILEFLSIQLHSKEIIEGKGLLRLIKGEAPKDFNEIVIKPLNGMGGESIYKLSDIGADEEALIQELTNDGKTLIVGQEFLPEIYDGDFRILIINGKPFKKTLARMPQGGSFKGNLAAGGKGVVKDINENQKKVAEEVGKFLLSNGINFAGIDMIGDYLTEINITSPTCAREIFDQSGKDPINEYLSGL